MDPEEGWVTGDGGEEGGGRTKMREREGVRYGGVKPSEV